MSGGVAGPPATDAAQAQRTVLAWRRTLVSFLVTLLLQLRLAAAAPAALRLTTAGLALTGWLLLLLVTRWRTAALRESPTAGPGPAAAVAAVAAAVYAALGVLLTLTV